MKNRQGLIWRLFIVTCIFSSCNMGNTDEMVETNFTPKGYSGLPVLKLDTQERSINSKEIWIEGASYELYGTQGELLSSGDLDIKGRGNSTWSMPKKPYSLKLAEKASLLDMSKHKRWVLLANYADKSLLRTEAAFKLGYIFNNLAWTPQSRQVDLYLNGNYRGVYQLTEQIKIDENRVDIKKIKSDKPQNGYILEADWRKGEMYNFTTSKGVVFCCFDPDEDLDDVFDKIKTDVQNVENVLYSAYFIDATDGYRKYLDTESFIDWYFVNEITKNVDSQFGLSVYMYYDEEKLKYCMGPVWDFDYAIGNVNYADSRYETGWWVKNSIWISRLFEDPVFVVEVKMRWNEKKAEVQDVFQYIDERAEYLNLAADYNFRKWLVLDKQVAEAAYISGSYRYQVDFVKLWLQERLYWLDGAINGL